MLKQLWLHKMYDSQSTRNSTFYEELDEKWSGSLIHNPADFSTIDILYITGNYRCGKVMFSQASVSHSVRGGG